MLKRAAARWIFLEIRENMAIAPAWRPPIFPKRNAPDIHRMPVAQPQPGEEWRYPSPMRYVFSASRVSCEIMVDGGPRTIFRDISFDIAPGEIVDLVGPSGAGKSSLLTAFARLNPRAHGDLTLQGRAASTFTPQQWRALVAYLPQKPVLPGACVADAIRLPYTLTVRRSAAKNAVGKPNPIELLPDAKIRETLDAMGCADIDLGRAPHDLSGGQAARVSLARTLLTYPKVLLADEVDAGLDDESADKVASILQQATRSGMAVIRIRHRPSDGRATRVMRLADGGLTQVGEGRNV